MSEPRDRSPDTEAVHAGEPEERVEGAVVLPVFQTAMYEFSGREGADEELRYVRYGNTPNHRSVARKLAALEGSESALVTASGMAAISSALLGLLSPGDHLLAQPGLYGGTHALFTRGLSRLDVDVEFLPGDDPDDWSSVVRPRTKVLYAETITNPTVRVADLEAMARFAREHGLTSVIDNTFATPVNFRPLDHGFDLSIHSATKYLNGHSDLVAGALAGSAELVSRAETSLKLYGGSLDPHACFLLERGMKTLVIRVARHNENALALARALDGAPGVARVNYPGLESHPDHERARRLLKGFGGMLSFELHGDGSASGDTGRGGGGSGGNPGAARRAAERFMDAVEIPIVAPSLGGVESLVTRPAATSHRGMPRGEREALGITDGLIRVSVGIEAAGDLVADVLEAVEVATEG